MRLVVPALTFILIISAVYAEDAGLGLQEAVDVALRQNPSLLASRSEVDAARANERGAGALSNPEIVVTPGIAGRAGSDEELSITQPLEINGQRRIRTRIAGAEKDAAQASYRSAERDVVRSVKQGYWDVAQAQSVMDLNRKNVELAEALHQAARRQVDVGSAPGAQLIKAQVELSRARQDLARSESDLAQAKASLNVLLGRPAETPFELSDKLQFAPLDPNSTALRASAEEQRPELAEAKSMLAARQAEIRAVDVRRRPDLALQARQEKLGGEGGLAVGISVPILDWGSVRQDKRRAEAAADAQAKRVEAVTNAVLLDVDSALREVERSRKLIGEYEQGVLSQAEQLSEMAQKGYKAGAVSYLEVLEAQRTLREVRAEYYTALADYQKALAQLEWAVGGDLSPAMDTVGAAPQSPNVGAVPPCRPEEVSK